ncbi:MAG: hypothetical protein ABSC05_25600 [Candidatus Solibacter sp.]
MSTGSAVEPDWAIEDEGGPAEALPHAIYGFSTPKYAVRMDVSFPPPYEGKRLSVYRSVAPGMEDCLSVEIGAPGCIENFVGALAAVKFMVTRARDHKSPTASIREVVTVVDQSPGLPERPPFTTTVKLVSGLGSDLQVFGYDESPLPLAKRAAERAAAKAAWRRYRQELFIDPDRQPFAVVWWRHTITGIRILRVDGNLGSDARTLH